MIAWLWWVFRYAPTIISVVVALYKMIREIKDPKEQGLAIAQFDHAMDAVKNKGDFSELERMKDKCGLRCRIEQRRARRGQPKKD